MIHSHQTIMFTVNLSNMLLRFSLFQELQHPHEKLCAINLYNVFNQNKLMEILL